MPQFLGQTQIKYPTNTDHSKQLSLLGDTIGGGIKERRDNNKLFEIGQAAQGGNLEEAANAAFRLGRPDIAMSLGQRMQAQKAIEAQIASQQAAQAHQARMFGLEQQRFGLAQGADARAQAGFDRETAMNAQFMGMFGMGQGAPQAPAQPPGGQMPPPMPGAPPATQFMTAQPGYGQQQAAPQQAPSGMPGGAGMELALSLYGKPEAAKTLRSIRENDPATIATRAAAQEEAKRNVARSYDAPQAQARASAAVSKAAEAAKMAGELASHAGLDKAVGPMQGRVPTLFSEKAADFDAELDTLKTKIFVTAINEMRELSKSGGALGSVTENEIKKMENSMRALTQTQSEGNMKKNLRKVADDFNASIKRVQDAYRREYGSDLGGSSPQAQSGPVDWTEYFGGR